MNRYDPTDFLGKPIKVGDLVVVGSNSGLSLGRVEKVFERDYSDMYCDEFEYSITITKTTGRRFTFDHNNMGSSKFWKVELDSLGNPIL